MSARALNWAWEQMLRVPGTPTKLVLVAIADRADDVGICWPSYRTLSEKCAVSEDTISRSVARLEKASLLTRERRRRPDGTLGTWEFHLALEGVPGDQSALLPPGETTTPQEEREPDRSSLGAETNNRDVSPNGDAQALVAHFVDESKRLGAQLPTQLIGRVGREAKRLSAEGFAEDLLRAAITRMIERGLSPATLPSVVLELQVRDRPQRSQLPPEQRAKQFVLNSGWQLDVDDLAEMLGRDFGIEGPEKQALLDMAKNVRASRTERTAA